MRWLSVSIFLWQTEYDTACVLRLVLSFYMHCDVIFWSSTDGSIIEASSVSMSASKQSWHSSKQRISKEAWKVQLEEEKHRAQKEVWTPVDLLVFWQICITYFILTLKFYESL